MGYSNEIGKGCIEYAGWTASSIIPDLIYCAEESPAK